MSNVTSKTFHGPAASIVFLAQIGRNPIQPVLVGAICHAWVDFTVYRNALRGKASTHMHCTPIMFGKVPTWVACRKEIPTMVCFRAKEYQCYKTYVPSTQ